MDWLIDLITNPFIITCISSWMVSQISKCIVHFAVSKEFDIKRLLSDGGMPSAHSATVSSVAIMSALLYGTGSFQFAISLVLAFIVCRDAMGVRRETGKQAVVINDIAKSFELLTSGKFSEIKLKDSVGHTPLQVMVGVIVGIVDAFIMYWILY